MSWTRVQTAGKHGTAGGSVTQAITATQSGSLLLAFGVGGTSVAFSDAQSQTWTLGTSYSNITSSGKVYRWGWILSTAAGVTSVTMTPGSGTDGWLQIVEYSSSTGTPALVAGSESNFTNGSGGTSVGGAVTGTPATGSLIVIGSSGNVTNGTTFTAGSGITTLVGFEGDANGSATGAVGENLASAASPQANLTLSPSNQAGATAMAFTSIVTSSPKGAQFLPFFT